MNFLRQSFSGISEPTSHISSNNPPSSATHAESDRDASLRATLPPPPAYPSSSLDSDTEDARLAPLSSAAAVDSLRTRNRIAIEDHIDVPDDGGGILIPSTALPPDWHSHTNMTSLMNLNRGFVFPGERVSIVVYVSSHDPSMPEIITPFRVAAMMEKMNQQQTEEIGGVSTSNYHDSSKAGDEGQLDDYAGKEIASSSINGRSAVGGSVLMTEEHKNRSAALLHMFQSSHFFTRILGMEEDLWKKEKMSDQVPEEQDDGNVSTSSSEHKKSAEAGEPVPIVIEGGDFDPRNAGGVARNARCYSFDNGDIAVVLQVTVATDLKGEVVLEVLQFEQPGKVGTASGSRSAVEERQVSYQSYNSNSSDQLLQWLLPLDSLQSPGLPTMAASAAIVHSSPQRPSLPGSSGSSIFSFANLRTYSSGSSSHSFQSSMAIPPQLSSTHGLDEWERSALQKPSKTHSSSKEGLLSFRGAQLEPQRFSVHCGLEGLYIPGWRWRRKIEIVEPVSIESYFADCNTEDLICVSVENVIPVHFPEILIIVDSISIVCQTPCSSSVPSSVPIACIEVGENHKLPGLSLRPCEQHSFILRPTSSSSHGLVNDKLKGPSTSTSYGHDFNTGKASFQAALGNGKKKFKDSRLGTLSQDSGNYVILVSCRCSHTESRLHFKHPIKWHPRSPRDLLVSVCIDAGSKQEIPNGALPSFVPKVVTVQATNLTSDSLHLTLLAPSSRYSGSSDPVVGSSGLSRMSSSMGFHERKEWPTTAKTVEDDSEQDKKVSELSPSGRPISLQRSLSLPPVKPIESIMGITPRVVKERAISAADISAENNTARTHLWLQSIMPLGSVPSQSTTSIRCELLPLTDGIISLDTLRISTKEQDVYYPEKPLQIYAMSSIGIGMP